MADPFSIDFADDRLTPALTRVIAALQDATPLFQDMGELMLASTKDNFAAGTSPEGTPWAAKSLTTMDRYRRTEGRKANAPVPTRPLIGVTRMLSTTIAYEVDAEGVSWGSNMIYAAVMQFGAKKGEFGTMANGASIPWGDIPARPFLGVGPSDETALLATIQDYLEGAAEG
ncbi:phage virion morphogenesis protein [Sagittula sp. S175]|uniref:phage virion morphogenesis protein n=1 Tax=Sagittula sp. S175 TaxID=3415129 RepID=UPI003C7A32F1